MSESRQHEFLQTTSRLTDTAVLTMLQAAVGKAEDLGIRATIAVTDSSGRLLGYLKMTDSFLVSSELARKKAITAAGMATETVELEGLLASAPDRVLNGLTSTEDFTVVGGGVPLFRDQMLVGGIGVSGGSEDQDVECARVAAQAIQLLRNTK